jgi:hypothetical protein
LDQPPLAPLSREAFPILQFGESLYREQAFFGGFFDFFEKGCARNTHNDYPRFMLKATAGIKTEHARKSAPVPSWSFATTGNRPLSKNAEPPQNSGAEPPPRLPAWYDTPCLEKILLNNPLNSPFFTPVFHRQGKTPQR